MQNKSSSKKENFVANANAHRCAIYARCASGVPEHSNASEQIRTCTEYAEKQGWKLAEQFVQTDIGASGISFMGCKSLMHLLEAATKEPRPFDCVLVADISRLGRSLDRVTKLVNVFHGRGVFIQTVRGQFDSRNLHPGAWTAKTLLYCSPQYLQPTGRQCPTCGR
jgi:DNA invertase Pin-like site-specific DNA recombinase